MRQSAMMPTNMTRRTTRRRTSLDKRISAAFERAIADCRPDVAEHLLCALEVLASDRTPASVLDRAYLLIAEPRDP